MAFIGPYTILAIILATFIVVGSWVRRTRLNGPPFPLPPGPKPLPLVGNIFDIPQDRPVWQVFREWGQLYGDIMYIHTFGRPMLIINNVDIARELLEKRGAIYSSRPSLPMANEVVGWKFSTASMAYCEKLKTHRKYLAHYFNSRKYPTFYPLQHKEVHRLVMNIEKDPDNLLNHIKGMSGGVTMMLAYGHQIENLDDHFIKIAEKGVATIQVIGAVGAHIVDFFPWLRFYPDWLPGAGFKRLPLGTREDLQNFVTIPFQDVKKRNAAGQTVPCYVTDLLEETAGNDEENIRDTAAGIYTGGFDTTFSSTMAAVINVVANPVIQARLQAEMDTVLGKDKLPRLEDKERLPYLNCVVLEAFRWIATTPVGVPHFLSEPDEYNGYRLPSGMMVMANAWAMLHDSRVYPEPEKFNPDRFLTGEGRQPQPDPRLPAFGFGRRVCPGMKIAETNLWLTLANIFYLFKITPARDADGNFLPIDLSCTEGTVRHTKPFQYEIKLRRENSSSLIQQYTI